MMRTQGLLRQERDQARRLLEELLGLLPASPRAALPAVRPRAGWPASKGVC